MEYSYNESEINKILAYLGTLPYANVKPFIDILMAGRLLTDSTQTLESVEAHEVIAETPVEEKAEVLEGTENQVSEPQA